MVYRKDRDSDLTGKKRGGGVLIAVKSDYQSTTYTVPDTSAEQVWVGLCYGNIQCTFCSVYIPPNSSFSVYDDHVNTMNTIMDRMPNTKAFIFGDYNLPNYSNSYIVVDNRDEHTHANSLSYLNILNNNNNNTVFVSSNECSRLLYDCVCFYDFVQLNGVSNMNNVVLDLMFSNHSCTCVQRSETPLTEVDIHHPPLDISIYFSDLVLNETGSEPKSIFNFFKADYNKLNNYFEHVDWNMLLGCNLSIDRMVECFYSVVYVAIDMFVPKKLDSALRFPTYYSQKTINLIKDKNRVYCRLKSSKSHTLLSEYRNLRARSKQSISDDYSHFISSSENNILKNVKSFWTYLRSKRVIAGYPKEMCYADSISSNPIEIANLLADFFQSVYVPGDWSTVFDSSLLPETNINLCMINIDSDLVFNRLADLDISKGAGFDKIPPVFLKNCSPTLSLPLSFIYQTSLNVGIFPTLWKFSVVTPLFKDGKRSDVNNYRPISGLSCIAKILESVVTDQIFASFKGIISENQHGFFSGRSCQTNLCTYSDFISVALDKASQVDSVYFDFRKAFDRVDHNILLQKLSFYGIGVPLLSWLDSYLRNRIQYVKFNHILSKEITAHSGVPQGSHLGPVLFLIFINDLSFVFEHCHYLFFADDLKIFRHIRNGNDCALLQSEVSKLYDWCFNNSMTLNSEKCKVISFSRKRQPLNVVYLINGAPIHRVELINDLGVVFDSSLRFNSHIDNIIARAFKMAGFVMRQCRQFKNVETLKRMYYALVRSHLEYCCVVWAPLYQVHIKRIERVQSRFINFLLYKLKIDRSTLSYKDRLSLVGLDSLEIRRIRLTLVFGHKILNNLMDCSELLFLLNFRVPYRSTRQVNLFSVNQSRTDIGRNSPANRIMNNFNLFIPQDFNINCSTLSFKNKIGHFIDDRAV